MMKRGTKQQRMRRHFWPGNLPTTLLFLCPANPRLWTLGFGLWTILDKIRLNPAKSGLKILKYSQGLAPLCFLRWLLLKSSVFIRVNPWLKFPAKIKNYQTNPFAFSREHMPINHLRNTNAISVQKTNPFSAIRRSRFFSSPSPATPVVPNRAKSCRGDAAHSRSLDVRWWTFPYFPVPSSAFRVYIICSLP
jgi:hypothetical protein